MIDPGLAVAMGLVLGASAMEQSKDKKQSTASRVGGLTCKRCGESKLSIARLDGNRVYVTYDGETPVPHVCPGLCCRSCGETAMTWKQVKGNWRLFKDGQLHDCPVNPLEE